MIIDSKKTCLVLDLDDTLYQEIDYQTSGLEFIEDSLSNLYGIDLKGQLIKFRDEGKDDIFSELIELYKLPLSIKDSIIHMYRYHMPKISLSKETKKFLEITLNNFKYVVILTDGRSITQRLKLNALGLEQIPAYISEEWGSSKPEKKCFIEIMDNFKNSDYYCYIGDNPSKDFIAPNSLEWASFCVRGNNNIHSQSIKSIEAKNRPHYWLNNLTEFLSFARI